MALSDFGSRGEGVSRRDALKGIGGVLAASAAATPASAIPLGRNTAQSSGGQQPSAPGTLPKRPNILWITGEGVPISALSCYGSRLIETPNIDRIAKDGLRFVNSFVTNGLCAPSRATLLTGTYNHINGMYGNPDVPAALTGSMAPHFDPAQETFPKILKRNGYQTGVVGKWHLPVNPAKVGFDYFVYKNGAGGPYYKPTGYLANPTLGSDQIEQQTHEGYVTDVMTDLCIQGMDKFRSKSGQPFLMMMQFFNDHRPFDPPHKYEHIYDGVRIPEPGTFWDDYSHRAGAAKAARLRIENMPDFHPPDYLAPRQRKQWNYQKFMEHFLGTLRAQDDNMGRLLDYLDKNGLADNTIVVYTCDHGFFLGDHGWFDKRFMYEQPIHVPWMIRCPGMTGRGTVTDEWVISIDNAPTVLDLCGLPIPAEMQGRSMAPMLRGESPAPRERSLYYHYYEFGPPHWVAPHYGIRTDRYKLIHYYTRNEWDFFDLERDPDEMDSLFLENGMKVPAEYQDTLTHLVAQLKTRRAFYKDNTGLPVILWPPGD